mgnify:CR=1 FL=1
MSDTKNIWQELQPLFRPAGIAVVGCSQKWGPGQQVIENLRQLGYQGKIFPINPKYDEITGLRCYPSLTAVHDAGEQIDMVAILLGRAGIPDIIAEASSVGVRAAWAFAAGFAELDAEGKQLERELVELCKRNNIRFLGPNCVGYLNPSVGVGTYSAPAPATIQRGHIGMVAQSGYLTIAIANSGLDLGFSLIVSTGNESVINSTDVMAYMLEDPETDIIIAFIEQFRDPEMLRAVAKRAQELKKPIIFIKVGRSAIAQRATSAHTGALAGSDAIQDALFKKLGLIRVDDLDEMFETARLLSALKEKLPCGNGIFAVTLSGGVISLLADVSRDIDIRFPAWSDKGKAEIQKLLSSYSNVNNPLDAWGSGRIEEFYETCLLTAAAEKTADIVLVVQDVPPGMAQRQVDQYSIVANAAVGAAKKLGKPVIMLSNASSGVHPSIKAILDEGGVPVLRGTRAGMKAIENAIHFAAAHFAEPGNSTQTSVLKYPAHAGNALTEYQSKQVLRQYDIPCTREIMCDDVESCVAAAEEIGYPVVMKVMSPRILHKTEAKVIGIGLKNADEIRSNYDRLLANARVFAPNAVVDGMLIQAMAAKPVAEVIIGITRDPQFGPAVVYGSGGILVEVLKDSVIGIPPLSKERALEMIRSTKGYRLLTGFRGNPPADIDALADTLVKVGRLAADGVDSLDSLDINPLLVYPEGQGVLAVDALIETQQ